MGSKGNKQTTQTAQSQTYTPAPQIQQSGELAMNQAIGAAQSPFQMPVAPVAGFNPFQQQAFGQVQGAQGMTDPYFAQARNYIDQSASPLTGGTVNQYYNPMADSVTAQLQNIFGQQNRQATGSATQAAGGVGADRIGVAQGNLANQQTLGAGQVYANLYQQAVQNAQADKARQQAAGYAYGQLGPAAQAANLQATSALGGAGNQQQQLAQQQANAPYQNILAQIAYPFQTSQFLAGITGGLAPAFGGTTAGYGTSQTQLPTPSPLNQILGVGTAGIGALGSAGAFGTGKGGSQIGSTYGATNNGSGFGYGSYGGTQVPTYFAEGGEVGGDESSPPPFPYLSLPKTGASPIPSIHLPMGGGQFHNNLNLSPPPTQSSGSSSSSGLGDVAKIVSSVAPFLLARGGAVNPYAMGEGFADGGDTDEDSGNPFDVSYVYSVPGAPIEAPDVPLPRGNPRTPGGARATMANELSRAGMPVTGIGGANMAVNDESGFNPYERHFDQPNPRFRGTEAQNSHGLYQEGGDEWNNYQAWLQKQKNGADLDWRDPALQTRFLAENMKENYPQVWGRMQNAQTPGQAAAAFTQGYLKPAAGPMAARTAKYLSEAGDEDTTDISARERTFNPYAPANTDMNVGQYHLPKGDQPYPDALNRDWGQNAARSPWMSLIHAGAAIASTTGPVGTAIAKGFGAGAGALENQRKELRTEQDQNLKADHLFQQAQMHLDEFTRMKPGQAGLLAEQHRYHDILDAQRRDIATAREKERQDALASKVISGMGIGDDGNMVPGIHQFNPETRQYEFKPNIIATKTGPKSAEQAGVEALTREIQTKFGRPPTAEEIANFKQSLKAQSPAQAQRSQMAGTAMTLIDESTKMIDDAMAGKTGPVTGMGGTLNRAYQFGKSFVGEHDTTPSDFQERLQTLQVILPRILAGTARISAAEKAEFTNILGGLAHFKTPEEARNNLMRMREILTGMGKEPEAKAVERPTGVPGDAKIGRSGHWYSPDPNKPGGYLDWGQ